MELHIIVRPKEQSTNRGVQKAGCIQFAKYRGNTLQSTGTGTIWWKQKFIHTRADTSHSVVTLDIPPNSFSRQLHFGFSLEILKNNQPIFFTEWGKNSTISNGFLLRLNLEAIQLRQPTSDTPLAIIYTRQPGLRPINQEVYYN